MSKDDKKLLLTASPHFLSPIDSPLIMYMVLIALVPLAIWGVHLYGLSAFFTIFVALGSAILGEFLIRLLLKRDVRIQDGSAAITGLLLALSLPPTVPLWITALGALFAIVVAKEFFGGLGANIFNPALVGRAFMVASFPAELTSWSMPRAALAAPLSDAVSKASTSIDAVSTATPLGFMRAGGDLKMLGEQFFHWNLSTSPSYGETIKTLFFGNHGGCIGESSILLILIGGLFLLATRVIDWRTPFAMIVTTALGSLLLGIDIPFALFSGALLFSAFFMATDYVTSPLTPLGRFIFGAGIALIILVIRRYGTYPEGVTYAILAMNALCPFLDRFLPAKYGKPRRIRQAEIPHIKKHEPSAFGGSK